MVYVFYILIVFLLIFSTIGFLAARGIARKKPRPDMDINEYSNNLHDPGYVAEVREWLSKAGYGYVKIKSPYFYEINAFESEGENPGKWVVLLHGVTVSHKYMMDLAYMYSRMGFGVLAWDSRAHGESGGTNISYGYYEKSDLAAAVEYIRDKSDKDIKIGLHGISMGAGILLAYASQVRDDCDFYIADCPYSDFYRQAETVIGRKLHTPDFITSIVMWFTKFFVLRIYGFDLKRINILDRIHVVENPMMFIDCRDDAYIPPQMTQELYEACGSGKKRILWFENGGHGGAYPVHRKEYEAAVFDFLKECGI
ncbi:MAG: alpha/beta hydrolase [Clostridia bacterium]|nr:alpha/beta hydrolase [Clostridia bacterium]